MAQHEHEAHGFFELLLHLLCLPKQNEHHFIAEKLIQSCPGIREDPC